MEAAILFPPMVLFHRLSGSFAPFGLADMRDSLTFGIAQLVCLDIGVPSKPLHLRL